MPFVSKPYFSIAFCQLFTNNHGILQIPTIIYEYTNGYLQMTMVIYVLMHMVIYDWTVIYECAWLFTTERLFTNAHGYLQLDGYLQMCMVTYGWTAIYK